MNYKFASLRIYLILVLSKALYHDWELSDMRYCIEFFLKGCQNTRSQRFWIPNILNKSGLFFIFWVWILVVGNFVKYLIWKLSGVVKSPWKVSFSLTSQLFFGQVGGFTYEPRGVVQLPKVFFSLNQQKKSHIAIIFRHNSITKKSLLVRLEQCRHSGWWEGRTHRRRSESLSRIRSLTLVCFPTVVVGPNENSRSLLEFSLAPTTINGKKTGEGGGELDYCPQMPRSSTRKEFSMFLRFFVQGLRETCAEVNMSVYDFLLVTVHTLNVLINVYSNRQWIYVRCCLMLMNKKRTKRFSWLTSAWQYITHNWYYNFLLSGLINTEMQISITKIVLVGD